MLYTRTGIVSDQYTVKTSASLPLLELNYCINEEGFFHGFTSCNSCQWEHGDLRRPSSAPSAPSCKHPTSP